MFNRTRLLAVIAVLLPLQLASAQKWLSDDQIQRITNQARTSGSYSRLKEAKRVLTEQFKLRSHILGLMGIKATKTTVGFKPDIFDAMLYEIQRAGYPLDHVDGQMYLRAYEHKARMAPPTGIASAFDENWFFRGPTNLDVPYRQYWGLKPVSGRVNAVMYDPFFSNSTYYIGAADGGVWKTTDSGATWTALSDDWDGLSVSALAMDPTNRLTIFAGTGDRARAFSGFGSTSRAAPGFGIMKSTDGGANWVNVGRSQMLGSVVTKILIDPDDRFTMVATCAGGSNAGVYRSTNAGDTWTKVTSLPSSSFMGASVSGKNTSNQRNYYVVTSGTSSNESRLFRSRDKGATWTEITIPVAADTFSLCDVSASPVSFGRVYLLVCNEREVHSSTDSGDNWTDITGNFPDGASNYNWSQSTYDWHITCTRRTTGSASDALYVGLIDLATSLNANSTWRSIGGATYDAFNAVLHNDQHCLTPNPNDPTEVLVGNDGGVYKVRINRTTGTPTVTNLNRNLGIAMYYYAAWAPFNRERIIGGSQDNSVQVSVDDLANWRNVVGGDGTGVAIDVRNSDRQYATNQNLGADPNDGDNSLTIRRTQHAWFLPPSNVDIDATGENIPFVGPIVLSQETDAFYVGTNFLNRWTDNIFGGNVERHLGSHNFGSSTSISAISVPKNANRLYVGTLSGRLQRSTLSGSIWTSIDATLPDRPILSINPSPSNASDVIVTLGGAAGVARVWRCTNVLASNPLWVDVTASGNNSLPDVPTSCMTYDLDFPGTTWYVGTDVGVFFTNDGGLSWFDMTEPKKLPNVRVTAIDWNRESGHRRLNVATWGRGFWRLTARTGEPWLGSVTAPTTLRAGEGALCFVALSRPAPSGGLDISFTSSNPTVLSVPASVHVAAGGTGAFFRAESHVINNADWAVTIDIRAENDEREIGMTVRAAMLEEVAFHEASVTSGQAATLTLRLICPAPPGGRNVLLSSSDPLLVLPSRVRFESGETVKTIKVGTRRVTYPTTVDLFARWSNMQELRAQLTLNP